MGEPSAVDRMPDQLDVFWTGDDGRVNTSWWNPQFDWGGPAGIGGFFPANAPVTSVARAADNLDLFIVGNDGRVYTSWWFTGGYWSGADDNWRSIGGFFPPGARSAPSPATRPTSTCSSSATTAASTPPGGIRAPSGPASTTTGARSAGSSRPGRR